MTQEYSREDARRLLRVSEQQLRSWEQQKLVQPTEVYGFRDLLALRTLIKLRQHKIPPQQIKRALHSLSEKLLEVENPLTELRLYADGKRVHVEVEGRPMEAESGQFVLDFGREELKRLVQFRSRPEPNRDREQRAEAEQWFQRGLELEQSGASIKEVLAAYERAIELDPRSAGALVNLGTIYFNQRNFAVAEKKYQQALEVDPEYALAHFDIANLYDERGDHEKALQHYLAAIKISPSYADAHYNVALLYQGANQTLKAVSHWMTYLKLDPSSKWASIARRELTKLRQSVVSAGSREDNPLRA
jgi:tetratricopeptide (TPR) repeat protein